MRHRDDCKIYINTNTVGGHIMNELTIIAGLRAFWDTITAAIADILRLHDAAAEGLDIAVEGGEALDLPGAGWAETLPGGPDMGGSGWLG
jgi:hypothetical protein